MFLRKTKADPRKDALNPNRKYRHLRVVSSRLASSATIEIIKNVVELPWDQSNE
jgi:hypothetical protein